MPELPEIVIIARQMQSTLRKKTIKSVRLIQPKCLNKKPSDYNRHLKGLRVEGVVPFGKWIKMSLENELQIWMNLGMGGEICFLKQSEEPPEKHHGIVYFTDGSGFFLSFWWFGYFHLVLPGESHDMTRGFGPDPMSLSGDAFLALLKNRKGGIKSFLLNQKYIRGIGNYYIQEILFRAKIHPLKKIPFLSIGEKMALHQHILDVLNESIDLGSSYYELDFFGKTGLYSFKNMAIAYRDAARCPRCGTGSKKIKTGTNSHYICPQCQKI